MHMAISGSPVTMMYLENIRKTSVSVKVPVKMIEKKSVAVIVTKQKSFDFFNLKLIKGGLTCY